MSDALRNALAELVACKDLKDKAEEYAASWDTTGCIGRRMPFYEESMRDYLRRQPLAWEAARAALAALPEQRPQAPDIAEVMLDTQGDKFLGYLIDDLDSLPVGTKVYAGAVKQGAPAAPADLTDELRAMTEQRDGYLALALEAIRIIAKYDPKGAAKWLKEQGALASPAAPRNDLVHQAQADERGKESGSMDSLALYKRVCDILAEANAVDTVIGRPALLMAKLTALRDDLGSMRAANIYPDGQADDKGKAL